MPYHHYTAGTSKEHIRDNVFLYFIDCSNILTLPNLYFNLEKAFIEDGKQVTCVERNYDIYIKQLIQGPKEIEFNHTDIEHFNISNYDGIFLDLCGTYCKAASNVFRSMKPGDRIAVTFLMGRESKLLQQVIDITNREIAYTELLDTYNISVKKCMKYNDSSPMCTFFGQKY